MTAIAAALALVLGFLIAFPNPAASVSVLLAFGGLAALVQIRRWWKYALWVALFGLALFSYGFNNVPLSPLPVPLADALVAYAVLGSAPLWWRLRQHPLVRRLLVLAALLSAVVAARLFVDLPRFGLLAARDALFALELWALFPAIALGSSLGDKGVKRWLMWLFGLCTAWFLLYPFRDPIRQWSPVVGIQRPVPLLAFTTAGFLAVPAVFWFLREARGFAASIGIGGALLVLLFVQGRGSYLALLLSGAFALFWPRPRSWRVGRLAPGAALAALGLLLLGPLPGRLGEPVGLGTAVEQLRTLAGEEGPGAGSYRHRLQAWPLTVQQVLQEPAGPILGVGLGEDLFQGFAIEGGVVVRKPHNDFLEVWARTGVLGFLTWFAVLVLLAGASLRAASRDPSHDWVVALQAILWIGALSQPAFGFAYATVVWAGLTGLWLGARQRRSTWGSGGGEIQ